MNPNSGRFLSRKWVFIVFAIMAFILASFVQLVLAEEQTVTPKAGMPTKKAEGDEHPHPEHDLAKASQNPVAKLISVPFENNATFNNGTEDVFVNILNIKPVIPMGLTENWNLINRAIVPVIYQEDSPNEQPGEGSLFTVRLPLSSPP